MEFLFVSILYKGSIFCVLSKDALTDPRSIEAPSQNIIPDLSHYLHKDFIYMAWKAILEATTQIAAVRLSSP